MSGLVRSESDTVCWIASGAYCVPIVQLSSLVHRDPDGKGLLRLSAGVALPLDVSDLQPVGDDWRDSIDSRNNVYSWDLKDWIA